MRVQEKWHVLSVFLFSVLVGSRKYETVCLGCLHKLMQSQEIVWKFQSSCVQDLSLQSNWSALHQFV